jgi:photosystem II stability/assembly factor-like uncharacterized protein
MAVVSDTLEADPAQSTTSGPRSAVPGRSLRLPSRRTLILIGLAWIGLASIVAVRQTPSGDPRQPTGPQHFAWWWHPVERNPLLRLPTTGSLIRIRRHPETGALYAVGAGGMILRSTDGGRTWNQRPVTWLPEGTSSQPPTPAPARGASNLQADDVRLASFDQSSPKNAVQQALPKKGDSNDFEQKTPSYEPPAPNNNAPPASSPEPSPPVRFSALVDIAFASGRGWAVGRAGTVLQSTDGGDTWSQTASGIRVDLFSIAVVDGGAMLCAVSDDGEIWRRETANARWSTSAFAGKDPAFIATRRNGEVWLSAGDGLYSSTDCQRWELRLARDETGGEFRELEFSRDGQSGWVAADKTVFRTTDSGATWRPSQPLEGSLALVHFADQNRGWVSSENGHLYASNDGGASWTGSASSTTSFMSVVAVGDTVFGASESHGLLVSRDAGRTWTPHSSPQVRDIFFLPDAQRGWAVGEHGLVLATSDGGRSWSSRSSGITSTLHDVQFLDEGRRGWAVGDQGVVLMTTDGGVNWREETINQTLVVYLAHFQPDGRRGAVFTDYGVYETTDGGSTWQGSTADFVGPPRASVRVDDGWIVRTDLGELSRYRAGNPRFELSSTFAANAFTRDARGWIWAVGPHGVVQASQDQGATWQPRDVRASSDDLRAVAFSSDGRQGWITGPRGVVLTTRNGGDSWERREVASTAPWHRLVALPTGGAISLAGGAAMYRTEDGIKWAPIEYAAFPAPWYYIAVAIGLGILTLVLSSGPDVVVSTQPSVADVFVSDRPLERGDPDALALNRVAAGIARFLANEKTDPPLTIAITGEWGSGKTSLMNLSRAMLQDFGFRTVWFNAWHHQTEEHLLGALIESLRRSALQPWWAPRGFAVRIRLLMFRGMRQWLPAAAALVGFGIAAGYFLQQPADRLWDAGSWLKGLLNFDASRLTTEHTFDVLSILGTAGGLTRLVRGMQAFGVSGKRLSTALTTYDPLKDLRLPTGFRHQFADTFRDITRALAPQQLVIFIDDLDRCQPANVVATLEMVNFLVSSGRCIVIIGMARDRVERCVGIGFKDVAELGADEASAGDPKLLASRRLERFARQYLEKLINIEIPVPQASPAASKQLLATAFQRREAYRQRWAASAVSVGQWLSAAVVVLALASAGYRGGIWIHKEAATIDAREREEASRQKQQESTTLAQNPVTPAATAQSGASDPNPERPPIEAVLVPAAEGSPWWPPVAFMAGLGVLLAVPRLARVPVHVEHDSTTFTDALDRWFPLVYGKTSTPRAIKRFLNRVRFYAMSQRDAAPPAGGQPAEIPEDALVALSVLQHAGASTVDEALAEVDLDVDPMWRARLQKDLEVALPYRDPFRHMSEGVSM